MKKLISLLTSITLCVGAMSALPANADYVWKLSSRNIRVVKSEEVKAYVEPYSDEIDIYVTVTPDETTGNYLMVHTSDGNAFGQFGLFLHYYREITVEQFNLISDYLAEYCPEVTASIFTEHSPEVVDCVFTYPDEWDYEKKFQLAVEIKEDLGLICRHSFFSNLEEVSLVGDLSSDNALTPVDASMLLSYYSDAQSGVAVASAKSGVDYSIIGDFNGDGVVTPSDASEILSYYADQQTA